MYDPSGKKITYSEFSTECHVGHKTFNGFYSVHESIFHEAEEVNKRSNDKCVLRSCIVQRMQNACLHTNDGRKCHFYSNKMVKSIFCSEINETKVTKRESTCTSRLSIFVFKQKSLFYIHIQSLLYNDHIGNAMKRIKHLRFL